MASKERYLIFPGSNFALKQPCVDAEKKRKAGINRARKRFPGYFSKELPHASWDEVITDWWAKMSPQEREDALAIRDPEVMHQIAQHNNQLLCQGILLQNGLTWKSQSDQASIIYKKRKVQCRGGLFHSSSSESDSSYPLLENFNNYFENSKDTIIHCIDNFITITLKDEVFLEPDLLPKIIDKASHRRFLKRKWIPRSEKEVWKSVSQNPILTWGDLETALALLLQNNLLKSYEPVAQQKMLQKLKCLEEQLQGQSIKQSNQIPKSKAAAKKKKRRVKKKFQQDDLVASQAASSMTLPQIEVAEPTSSNQPQEEEKTIPQMQHDSLTGRSNTSDDISATSTPRRPKKSKKHKIPRITKLNKKIAVDVELTPKKANLRKAAKKNYTSMSPVAESSKELKLQSALKVPNYQKEFKEKEIPTNPVPTFSISQLLNKAKPFVPSINSKRSPDNSSESELEPRLPTPPMTRRPPEDFKSFELSESLVFEVRKRDWRHYQESIIPSTQDTESIPYHSDYDHDYFFHYEEEFPLPGQGEGIRVYRTKQSRSRESSVSSAGRYERDDTENESDDQMREIVRMQEEETIRKFREAGVKIERCSEAEQELIYNQRLQKQKFKRSMQLGTGDENELLMAPVVKQFEEQEYARQMLFGMFASMMGASQQPCLTYEHQSSLW